MYYPNFFGGVRPFERLQTRERIENPLDLSVKQSVGRVDGPRGSDRPELQLLMEQKLSAAGLSSQPLPPQTPLLDSLYSYKPFGADSGCHMGSGPLLGQNLTNAYCGSSSSAHPINHLGLIPDLLHQNRDPLVLEASPPSLTHFGVNPSSIPYHMRIGSSAAAVIASQRAYFGHNSVLGPHMSTSFSTSIPHISLYSDLMSDITRRSVEADKGLFGTIPPIRPPEPSTRFSEHLQRLREQHIHQTKCTGPCCMPSTVHNSGPSHSNGCNCCEVGLPLSTNMSTLVMSSSHTTPVSMSLSCSDECNRDMIVNKPNVSNHCLNTHNDNNNGFDDISRHISHQSLASKPTNSQVSSRKSPKPQPWMSSLCHHKGSDSTSKSTSNDTNERKTESFSELEIITLDEECSESETKAIVTCDRSEQPVSSQTDSLPTGSDQSLKNGNICDQKDISKDKLKLVSEMSTEASVRTDRSDDGLNCNTYETETKQECIQSLKSSDCTALTAESGSTGSKASAKVNDNLSQNGVNEQKLTTCETSQERTRTKTITKQLKDYKPVPKHTVCALDRNKRQTKETKTVEVQCDGPDWTPIVLPIQLKNKLEKAIRNKLLNRTFKNRSSFTHFGHNKDSKKIKKCKQKHFHRNQSRSRSPSSSTSSRMSSPDRYYSSECLKYSSKAKKRSMLQCLVNSDGYVADKIKKTDHQLNLIGSDPSQLGREERALQRAIKHFEDQSKPSGSEPMVCSEQIGHFAEDSSIGRNNKPNEEKNKDNNGFGSVEHSIASNVSDTYEKIIESVVSQSRCQEYSSVKILKKSKKSNKSDEKVLKSMHGLKENKESEELVIKCEAKTKPKKKLRPELAEDSDRKHQSLELNCKQNQNCENDKNESQKNSKHIRHKKAMVSIRRRRFRSGLDMIRQPQRKKKTKPNQSNGRPKEGPDSSAKELDQMNHKSGHFEPIQGSVPTEIKRLMVNKALGETLLHRAARSNRQDVVNFCLQSGTCDVNARDNANYTPLHECCTRGHIHIAKMLLQNGADVNASAAGGIRPLHDAIEGNHIEVVRLLLAYGADPNITTYSGATPLQLSRSKAMLKFLKGFLSDISSEWQTQTTLGSPSQLPPPLPLHWKFKYSFTTVETCAHGFDPLEGLPEDTCEDTSQELLFETSASPIDPTYRLPNKESEHFMRLSDILKRTGLTREEFSKKHTDVEVMSVTKQEIETANVRQFSTKAETVVFKGEGQTESMVLFDDKIRNILGIETLVLRCKTS